MRVQNRYSEKEQYHQYIEKSVIEHFLQNNNIKQTAKLFHVNLYYIEIWGMIEREHYKKRMIKKVDFYQMNGLQLISIFPKDDIQQKLSFLIPLYSTTQKTIEEYR